MTPEAAAALEASIEKWERNACADHPDDVKLGPEYCPLCQLFWEDDCESCPIAAHTGQIFCKDTPYERADIVAYRWEDYPDSENLREAFREAAEEEVAFLKSLRETGE